MAVGGVGNGAFWPSQSTLLAGLAPPERRHSAYALQRVSRNLGIGLGGLSGGLIATTESSSSYTVLFALDAVTFLVFVGVLWFVPDPELPGAEAPAGRYVDVLRDRLFLGVVGLNALFVAAGYAVFELLPVYAKNEAGVSERAIGVIFFVNTLVIVLAQLPLVKLLEGRPRMRALALMTVIWAGAWLVVLAGGRWFEAAAAALVFGIGAVIFGLGECFHGPNQGALVADLAPERVRGRYMAFSTLSWEVGFAIGPAVGGLVLDRSPNALWVLAAATCLVAGLGAVLLERRVPPELQLTPVQSA
jgi:predicted MFS family arabinose efflux permease